MKLVASYSRKEAYEILAEVVKPRAKRKKGEALSPGEELLLDVLFIIENKKNPTNFRRLTNEFICLGLSLKLYPVPKWWHVKRRMFPMESVYSLQSRVSMFTAERLLQVTRETKRTKKG